MMVKIIDMRLMEWSKIQRFLGMGIHILLSLGDMIRDLGKWKSLDPLMAKLPHSSPYVAFGNNPIYFVDLNGLIPTGGGIEGAAIAMAAGGSAGASGKMPSNPGGSAEKHQIGGAHGVSTGTSLSWGEMRNYTCIGSPKCHPGTQEPKGFGFLSDQLSLGIGLLVGPNYSQGSVTMQSDRTKLYSELSFSYWALDFQIPNHGISSAYSFGFGSIGDDPWYNPSSAYLGARSSV
jgi:hypothetical protein